MKIILIESINSLGKIGDIVSVKDGFAKNYLIPQKKAICWTVSNFKVFESKRADYEKLNSNSIDLANKVKSKIEAKNIIILQNASDDGRLYGSVNPGVIANKINEIIGEKLVGRSNVVLKKPIKEIGVYEFKLSLHSQIDIELKLAVSRSESEAEILLNPELKKEKNKASEEENSNKKEEVSEPKKRNTRKSAKKTAQDSE